MTSILSTLEFPQFYPQNLKSERKLMADMNYGILASGSCLLTNIDIKRCVKSLLGSKSDSGDAYESASDIKNSVRRFVKK